VALDAVRGAKATFGEEGVWVKMNVNRRHLWLMLVVAILLLLVAVAIHTASS
jgi:hypothetical protein